MDSNPQSLHGDRLLNGVPLISFPVGWIGTGSPSRDDSEGPMTKWRAAGSLKGLTSGCELDFTRMPDLFTGYVTTS